MTIVIPLKKTIIIRILFFSLYTDYTGEIYESNRYNLVLDIRQPKNKLTFTHN